MGLFEHEIKLHVIDLKWIELGIKLIRLKVNIRLIIINIMKYYNFFT